MQGHADRGDAQIRCDDYPDRRHQGRPLRGGRWTGQVWTFQPNCPADGSNGETALKAHER